MAVPVTHELGAFAEGEVPPDLQVSFKDYNGAVVNLAGFTPHMRIQEDVDTSLTLGAGTIAITDEPNGVVTYTWLRADMENEGRYTAQVWVNNGTKYYASDLYIYDVYDGPGEPPA